MTDAEKKKAIILMLGEYLPMYPESKISGEGLKTYARVLVDYPLEQLRAGMEKAIRKSEFFPKPVHIINAIEELKAYISTGGNGIPDAGEAFKEMVEQAKLHSVFTDKWKFSTPAIAKAVQRFGKNEVLYMQESEIGIARAQFRKIYEEELHKQAEQKLNNEVLQGGVMADLVDKLASNSRIIALGSGANWTMTKN